jgi:hypothetical protein
VTLAAPGGFSNHEWGQVFRFDLAHIVFYTAFMAWIYPYLVLSILKGMSGLKPFFKPFYYHKPLFRSLFAVNIGEKNGSLNEAGGIFRPVEK